MIQILAIVLIARTASWTRAPIILSMLVATVTIRLCMGAKIVSRQIPIIRVAKIMMIAGIPYYVIIILLANTIDLGFLIKLLACSVIKPSSFVITGCIVYVGSILFSFSFLLVLPLFVLMAFLFTTRGFLGMKYLKTIEEIINGQLCILFCCATNCQL